MAIVDKLGEFCDAVALNTGGAGTYLIGSQIDLGLAGRDVGNGEPVYLVITVDTAIEAAGAGTVTFKLASDDSASISTTTSTIHLQTSAIATSTTTDTTTLVAGTVLFVGALPQHASGATYERYLGILQTTATQAITAGKINAYLTKEPPQWIAYDSPAQA